MTQGMKRITLALAAAMVATQAQAAVGVKAGAWDFEVSGEVNGFAMFTSCGVNAGVTIQGVPAACTASPNQKNVMSIQSGLLPSALVFTLKTRQLGLDVAATVGLYPGIGSNLGTGFLPAATPDRAAVGMSTLDVRQNFLTFGDKSWGTIKIGRDLGLFGDVILQDMTLLGVGGYAANGAYVTFGHIGTGYPYADWHPQITYFSPDIYGFKLAIGAFQGMNISNLVDGLEAFAGLPAGTEVTLRGHETPRLEGKLSYSWGGAFSGMIWVDGVYQHSKSATMGISSAAVDGGLKLGFSGLDLVGYGYYGKAIGNAGFGQFAVSATGGRRKSWGFLGQLTYKIGRLKPGVSYGESHLDMASDELTNTTLINNNRTLVGGLYYGVTDSLTLVAEYVHAWTSNHTGTQEANSNTGALGAILFF